MGRATIVVLMLLCLGAHGQTKEEKRRQKEQAREAEHHRRQQALYAYEQRRFACGRAARVTMAAPAERVKVELITRYTKGGWAIASDSQYQIGFMRDQAAERSVLTYLFFGESLPNHYKLGVQYSMSAEGDTVTVSGIAEALVQDGYGRVMRYALGENAEVNDQMCAALLEVKEKVEREAAAASEAEALQEAAARAQQKLEAAEKEAAQARKEFSDNAEEALDYIAAAAAEARAPELIYKMELSKARDSAHKLKRRALANEERDLAAQVLGLLAIVEECRMIPITKPGAATFRACKEKYGREAEVARRRVESARTTLPIAPPRLTPPAETVSETPK